MSHPDNPLPGDLVLHPDVFTGGPAAAIPDSAATEPAAEARPAPVYRPVPIDDEAPEREPVITAAEAPAPRRTAEFRNFRSTLADPVSVPGFRLWFAPQGPVAAPLPDFTPGSGRCAPAGRSFESLPIMVAGNHAVAELPAETPRIPGRQLTRWGIATAVLLSGACFVVMRRAPAPAASLSAPATVAEVLRNRDIASLPDQIKIARDFFAATTVQEKIGMVRGGAALQPVMEQYYALHPDEPEDFEFVSAKPGAGGDAFTLLTGVNRSGRPIQVLTEHTGAGLRLDWRALTGAGDLDWDTWLTTRPAKPVGMRVEARIDSYFPAPFDDRAKYFSLRITDLADEHTAWAFVERQTEAGRKIAIHMPPGGTLRLEGTFIFPPESSSGPACAALTRINACHWLDLTREVAVSDHTPHPGIAVASQQAGSVTEASASGIEFPALAIGAPEEGVGFGDVGNR